MSLERIIWKDNDFVKESDGSKVKPQPIGPLFKSYHPEGDIEYESRPGELTEFYKQSAEYHLIKAVNDGYISKKVLTEVNAFKGDTVCGDGGGDFAVIQLYKI
jgi:hypothetical protein